MKKIAILSLAAALVALTACTKESDPPTLSKTVTSAVHVVSADGSSVTASMAAFNFTIAPDYLSFKCSGLSLGSTTADFDTDKMPMEYAQYPSGINYAFDYGKSVSGTTASGLGGNIVGSFYLYTGTAKNIINLSRGHDLLVLRGEVNGCKINAFPTDCFYKGLTTTRVNGDASAQGFQTEDILYGVSINLATKKATVVMYDAQLNPKMPKLNIVLEGLDFILTSTGYRISGTDIVPGVIEGGSTTPNPGYKFDSFEFATRPNDQITKSDFTAATIDFTVRGGMFTGQFSGRWPEVYNGQ